MVIKLPQLTHDIVRVWSSHHNCRLVWSLHNSRMAKKTPERQASVQVTPRMLAPRSSSILRGEAHGLGNERGNLGNDCRVSVHLGNSPQTGWLDALRTYLSLIHFVCPRRRENHCRCPAEQAAAASNAQLRFRVAELHHRERKSRGRQLAGADLLDRDARLCGNRTVGLPRYCMTVRVRWRRVELSIAQIAVPSALQRATVLYCNPVAGRCVN